MSRKKFRDRLSGAYPDFRGALGRVDFDHKFHRDTVLWTVREVLPFANRADCKIQSPQHGMEALVTTEFTGPRKNGAPDLGVRGMAAGVYFQCEILTNERVLINATGSSWDIGTQTALYYQHFEFSNSWAWACKFRSSFIGYPRNAGTLFSRYKDSRM